MKHHHPRRHLAAAVLVPIALASAACSGPADSSTSTKGGDAPPIVGEMQELIDQHSKVPEFEAPGPAIDASQLEGKTVAIVAIDLRIPAIADVASYAEEAAELVGLDVTVFDAKSQATAMQQGMQQAIDAGADAIISDGLVIEVIDSQITAAKERGIPTIDVINTPPEADVPGQGSAPDVFATMAVDAQLAGRLMAAAAIVHTDGAAKVALMNTSELTASEAVFESITSGLGECDDCEVVAETDTALNDWSTEITGLTATQVRSNPDVNFLLPMYDAMGIFATTGVQQAAATGKVQIASQDGTPAALNLVKQGDVFVADVSRSTAWAAWGAIDQAMRGMLAMDPADPFVPVRYVDTPALQDVDTSTSDAVNEALFGSAFKDGYTELWGLS